MDNKKEQERAELHRTIWNIANDLRGSVDGWDFKQYVLGMLFYRYISENLTAYINAGEREAGDDSFDYANISDNEAEPAREDLVKTKGFFILPSELFANVHARAKDDENLNETLERIFSNIEASAQGTDSVLSSPTAASTAGRTSTERSSLASTRPRASWVCRDSSVTFSGAWTIKMAANSPQRMVWVTSIILQPVCPRIWLAPCWSMQVMA